MILDVYVSTDNKQIWDKEFFEGLGTPDPKKWRLDNFTRAHARLSEMNRKFNDPENKGLL